MNLTFQTLASDESNFIASGFDWLLGLLAGFGVPREVSVPLILILMVLGTMLGACSYAIWLERKLSAWIQDRKGPNRVGWAGLFQPIADGAKFLLKEDIIPAHVDKVLFVIAPAISVFTTLLALSVVPLGPTTLGNDFQFMIAPKLDMGIVFLFSVTSLAVYGIILGGWSSNNKYSALGGLRSSAQVVSYEIPLGMSVLGIALMAGSLNLETVIDAQAQSGLFGWNIWYQPLAAFIFFLAALAESNRLPFDLAECEQELIGGYHTEYSALKFGLFFLGEYTHVFTISFLCSVLFFGGWHFPYIAEPASVGIVATVLKIGVLLTKVFGVIVLIMLLRWCLPRFRFDQLMGLCWKALIPLSLGNMVCVMIVREFELSWLWLPISSILLFCTAGYLGFRPAVPRSRPVRPAEPLVASHH
ncbi:MAG: NADH-quinone oxidoreductase subunit NuoH [Planctomycetaceae bacterium]